MTIMKFLQSLLHDSEYDEMLLREMERIDEWNSMCRKHNEKVEDIVRKTRENSIIETPLGSVFNFRNPPASIMIEMSYTDDMKKLKEKLKK